MNDNYDPDSNGYTHSQAREGVAWIIVAVFGIYAGILIVEFLSKFMR